MKPEDRVAFLSKLRCDLEEAGKQDSWLHWNHHVHQRLVEILAANPALDRANPFWTWLSASYTASASAAVRRLLDPDTATASLASIVVRLCKHPYIITRPDYVAQHTPGIPSRPAGTPGAATGPLQRAGWEWLVWECMRQFDRFARPGDQHLCPAKLEHLLASARSQCDKVLEYVDKRVAHHDRRPPRKLPTMADLDKAIGAVGGLFSKLSVLLTGSAPTEPTPTWQGDDWEWVFRLPWIADSPGDAEGIA